MAPETCSCNVALTHVSGAIASVQTFTFYLFLVVASYKVNVNPLRSPYDMDRPSVVCPSSVICRLSLTTFMRPDHRVELIVNIFAPLNSSGT